MAPHGDDAGRITALAWFMFSLSGLITLVVFAMLVVGIFRRAPEPAPRDPGKRMILLGGFMLPVVVLSTLAVLTVFTLRRSQGEGRRALAVQVVAHQFWWEVHYPASRAVTANEIHVPVGVDVDLALQSVDVIHSFWVPALGPKVDMIPGRTNHLTLHADDPGTYRGQCAEYCGLQHAHMIFTVVAESRSQFDAWLRTQNAVAAAPTGSTATQGAQAFRSEACAGCHTIRGTNASGRVGPDLTHVASRTEIAAGTLANDPTNLRRWIGDAPSVKPGALMPDMPLPPQELDAITAYLETLR